MGVYKYIVALSICMSLISSGFDGVMDLAKTVIDLQQGVQDVLLTEAPLVPP